MRYRLMFIAALLVFTTNAFADDPDEVEKMARPEREQLAKCLSDTLPIIDKYKLGPPGLSLLDASCAIEVERVQRALRGQLKDPDFKEHFPGMATYSMVQRAGELYRDMRITSCSGTGCVFNEYRSCLIRGIPAALKDRSKPASFEAKAKERCLDAEGAVLVALVNDLGNVLRRHLAGGVNHSVNDAIRSLITGAQREVVVLYGEDLVKVQPGRKSCRPEMCGASECLSTDVDAPSEYECVINQK